MKAQLWLITAALTVAPSMSYAQARMPHKDAGALGVDVGIFLPKEDELSSGPVINGFYEYYLNARDSLRVGFGWMNPKFDREDTDKLRHIRLALDLVHNWEGGSVHPFAGAGIGTTSCRPATTVRTRETARRSSAGRSSGARNSSPATPFR